MTTPDERDEPDQPADPRTPEHERPTGQGELDEIVASLQEHRATLARLTEERDRARAEASAIRGRPLIRAAVGVTNRVRRARASARSIRPAGALRRAAEAPLLGRIVPSPPGTHRLRASAPDEATLVERIRAAAPDRASEEPAARSGSRLVAVIRSGGDPDRLAAVSASIRHGRADTAIVVLDRGTAAASARSPRTASGAARIVIEGGTYADAVRAADDAGAGDDRPTVLLFVHDDLDIPASSAITRLVETLDRAPGLAAACGQLLLPRRAGPRLGPVAEAPDLTIAGLGATVETGAGRPVIRPLGRGSTPRLPGASEPRAVPLASAACLAVRRGALDPSRGNLDVDDDLAPAIDVRAGGGDIGVDERAVFLHEERSEPPDDPVPPWAHRLVRSVGLDRLWCRGRWSNEPFHVGITVSSVDQAAGFGDWYTAHELGDELARLGWRCTYLERRDGRWYDPPPGLDAVVVLLDLFDITRLPPGVIRIAWARNWIDHWIERPWFEEYDIVLTTSSAAKALVDERTSHVANVFPLATNPARFEPGAPVDGLVSDVAFVGGYFGHDRAVGQGLTTLRERGLRVGLWGTGWEDVPGVGELSRGRLDYDRVPGVYRSTKIVIDDTSAASTRDFGMVNSRVFDALATGTPVVTNNVVGARDLFDDAFPTWSEPDDLEAEVARVVADPEAARASVERYRAEVLARHTYRQRAVELRALVDGWLRAERWAIAIGPRTREDSRSWGDTYFARAVRRALVRRGRPTSVHVHGEWAAAEGRADVVLHLFGARAPRPRPGPVSLLWVISHPDRIDGTGMTGYDHVLVASTPFAERMAALAPDAGVSPLHQATDPDRFRPTPGAAPSTSLLFVGSSRGWRRPMVDAAIATGREVAVFGGGWTADLVDPAVVRGPWLPNEELAGWYSAASIVLADHYGDMREFGFISNRVYDALACGAFVLSDDVAGLESEFDGGAVACATEAEAIAAIELYLADPIARAEHAARGRAAVLDRHTFAHRAEALVELVASLRARAEPDALDPIEPPVPSQTARARGRKTASMHVASVARAKQRPTARSNVAAADD
jgi:spore maturation protein CgeB